MMAGPTIDAGRRRFFRTMLREQVAVPVMQAHSGIEDDVRRELFEQVYESELRAFGPDVLADAARRSGLAADTVNYADLAKALVAKMDGGDDGRS